MHWYALLIFGVMPLLACHEQNRADAGSGTETAQIPRDPALPPAFLDRALPVLIAKLVDPACVSAGCNQEVLNVVSVETLRPGRTCAGVRDALMSSGGAAKYRTVARKFAADGEDQVLIVPESTLNEDSGGCSYVVQSQGGDAVEGHGFVQSDLTFGFLHRQSSDGNWIVIGASCATSLAVQIDQGVVDLPPSGRFGDLYTITGGCAAPLEQVLREVSASNARTSDGGT